MDKVLFLLFLVVSFVSFPQDRACHRVAHVDVEYVLTKLPSVQRVDSIIYQQKTTSENNIKPTFDHYQQLYAEVAKGVYKGVNLEDKRLELEQLENKINNYNYQLKSDLVLKQKQLMKPIFDLLEKEINVLASSGDYDYVLSSISGESSVVLFCKESGDDLTQVLLDKLVR